MSVRYVLGFTMLAYGMAKVIKAAGPGGAKPPIYGIYEVEELRRDDEIVPPAAHRIAPLAQGDRAIVQRVHASPDGRHGRAVPRGVRRDQEHGQPDASGHPTRVSPGAGAAAAAGAADVLTWVRHDADRLTLQGTVNSRQTVHSLLVLAHDSSWSKQPTCGDPSRNVIDKREDVFLTSETSRSWIRVPPATGRSGSAWDSTQKRRVRNSAMNKAWSKQSRFVTAAAVVTLLASPAAAQSDRPTVAILDLDFGAVHQWWSGDWDIGKGVADLIVDGLLEDGAYRVIERKQLDAILAEQDFSNSDRAEPGAAAVAEIGKAFGVRYLIVGSITKFGTEKKKLGIGGRSWGGGKFGVGNIGTEKGKATVALALRMVDTSTGEILASAKGEATSSRRGLLLGGGGGGGGGAIGGVEMGSDDFRETVLGEATEEAVNEVVTKLTAAKTRLTSPE
ncbi:MAG: hypothetical protein GEU99_02605 [Luteitalea sp.]|nr:hypothetical protein [Luteitalea sp.]